MVSASKFYNLMVLRSNPSNFLLNIIIYFCEKVPVSIFLLNEMILYFLKHLPGTGTLLRTLFLCHPLVLLSCSDWHNWGVMHWVWWQKKLRKHEKNVCLICFLWCVGLFQWLIWFKWDIKKKNEIFHVERMI